MTLIKERAIKMIQRMPEENMLYVINILQNLEAMSADKEKGRKKAETALAEILNMEKRLPEDFDPEKELQEAREDFTDFEDCLQEECAVEAMADYIVTRNPNDYIASRIKVIEPGEFIKLL